MNRLFAAVIVAALTELTASAGTPKEDYIAKYSKIARSEMQRTGVPASITLAQGLLESGAGTSTLARKANNHFGIKCGKSWTGKTIAHDDDAKGECFRVYDNPTESYRDHSNFLRYSDRYKFLFDYRKTDYKSWAYGLKKAGYATDPKYATKLIEIVEAFNLSRFDNGVDVPETPAVLETPRRVKNKEGSKQTEQLQIRLERPVYEVNGVRFVYASQGETYQIIARSFDLFVSEIRRFNDVSDSAYEPLPGEAVFVGRKKARAAKGVESFFVEDETLRDVAQRFGVREASLRRLNKLPKDYVPVKGDEIKLR